MDESHTTAVIQSYLDELNSLKGDSPADPLIRTIIARSVDRLSMLCGSMLYCKYERLTRPPLNLRPEELLGAVVERMLKALNSARPGNVRQFFFIVNQHVRWELNDLARRLDAQTQALPLLEHAHSTHDTSGSPLSANAVRMLEAIDHLPADEREVFELVRIQGMSHPEVAEIVGASTKTVQRRLQRALILLSEKLEDLRPDMTSH